MTVTGFTFLNIISKNKTLLGNNNMKVIYSRSAYQHNTGNNTSIGNPVVILDITDG